MALPASLPLGRYFHTPLDRMSTPTPIGCTCQFPTWQVFPHSPQLDVHQLSIYRRDMYNIYLLRFDRLQQEPQSSAVLQTYTHASYRLPSDLHSCLIPIAVRLTLVYMTRVVFLLDQYIDTCGLPAGSAHRHMWSSETGTGVIQVFDRSLIYDYYITSLPIPSLP